MMTSWMVKISAPAQRKRMPLSRSFERVDTPARPVPAGSTRSSRVVMSMRSKDYSGFGHRRARRRDVRGRFGRSCRAVFRAAAARSMVLVGMQPPPEIHDPARFRDVVDAQDLNPLAQPV